jgi:hypothetical protein
MRSGQQLPGRLAAQHIGALGRDQFVGRVGLAALELLDGQRAAIALHFARHPLVERPGIELVSFAHRAGAAVLRAPVHIILVQQAGLRLKPAGRLKMSTPAKSLSYRDMKKRHEFFIHHATGLGGAADYEFWKDGRRSGRGHSKKARDVTSRSGPSGNHPPAVFGRTAGALFPALSGNRHQRGVAPHSPSSSRSTALLLSRAAVQPFSFSR